MIYNALKKNSIKMTMNMSAFEQLDNRELLEVDGGTMASAGVFIIGGAIVAGINAILAGIVDD